MHEKIFSASCLRGQIRTVWLRWFDGVSVISVKPYEVVQFSGDLSLNNPSADHLLQSRFQATGEPSAHLSSLTNHRLELNGLSIDDGRLSNANSCT